MKHFSGCGINLYNEIPTISVNNLLQKSNETDAAVMKSIQSEIYFATVFNEIETFFNCIQKGDVADFYEQYYKYWLHR